jgi:hypothetical protein
LTHLSADKWQKIRLSRKFKRRAKGRKVVIAMRSGGFSSSYKGNMPDPKGKPLAQSVDTRIRDSNVTLLIQQKISLYDDQHFFFGRSKVIL